MSGEQIYRSPLETELETFEALLPGLLETNEGDWALIKEAELGGIFSNQGQAINGGYEKYGNSLFLTQQILKEQPTFFIGEAEAA